MRLLVVDDDAEVRDLLVGALERDGHRVVAVATRAEAESQLDERDFDIVVLDLALADGDGVSLCNALREAGDDVPILMLTAHSEVATRVRSLDAGADDFLAKPFAVAELRARVRALGRRRAAALVTPVLRSGALVIDLGARRASRQGESVLLAPREWAVLDSLAGRVGRVVARSTLLDEIWGEATDATRANLEVLIGRIRRKLGEDLIRTVRGEGYVLET